MIWDRIESKRGGREFTSRRLVKRLGCFAVLRRPGRGDGPFFCDGLFSKSR